MAAYQSTSIDSINDINFNINKNEMKKNISHTVNTFSLQCCQCPQRIKFCSGCGKNKFIIIKNNTNPSSKNNTNNYESDDSDLIIKPFISSYLTSNVVSQNLPTAFELFCRHYAKKNIIKNGGISTEINESNDMKENEKEKNEEEKYNNKRHLAELWLSADAATRERYEAEAIALAHINNNNSKSDKDKLINTSTRKKSRTDNNEAATAQSQEQQQQQNKRSRRKEGDPYKYIPTAYSLFSRRNASKFQNKFEILEAWKGMSEEEKKPFDDEVAAIRVRQQQLLQQQ